MATRPGISFAPSSPPISVLMAMPRKARAWAAAMDMSRGRRPSFSMKRREAAVANMKQMAFPVARRHDASFDNPTLLCRTRGR